MRRQRTKLSFDLLSCYASLQHGPKPQRKMKEQVQHIVDRLVKSSADGSGAEEGYVGSDRFT